MPSILGGGARHGGDVAQRVGHAQATVRYQPPCHVWPTCFGDVAQLVERDFCIVDVRGSIPLFSTIRDRCLGRRAWTGDRARATAATDVTLAPVSEPPCLRSSARREQLPSKETAAGSNPAEGTTPANQKEGKATMAPTTINDRLITWADDLDQKTIHQACETSKLPIIAGHVALMPDAHMGFGCAIGSVVPTEGAIIPSAVGVDIGCGMSAVRTDLTAGDLPETLGPLLVDIEARVPAGVGQGRDHGTSRRIDQWLHDNKPATELTGQLADKAAKQLGTLGSGNHFLEVSLDEHDRVWIVLHSGSRGPGNMLAQGHIKAARMIERHADSVQFDPELAWFTEHTPEFDHYIADLRWGQAYAFENREIMLDEAADALFKFVGRGRRVETVRCHHNYAERERHGDRDVWVTRKGAIRAGHGELGIIPGSMGTDTYIVEGLGSEASWCSASHGAGRRMSRNQARKTLTPDSLAEQMGDRAWLNDRADRLVDEHPDAYKDIRTVMANQADLARIRDRLTSILNFKG